MKDIMLRITGRQIDRKNQVDSDSVEFMTEGKLYSKNGATYILYEESEMSGMKGVTTSLRIDGDGSIRMKRFGHDIMLDTVMEFKKGKRFSSLYETQYGSFEMEILTDRIVNTLDTGKCTGELLIDYEISLKGLAEGRNLLSLEIFEKNGSDSDGGEIK